MNKIAWTGRGNVLVARVVMNGVPLFVAYNRSSRFLGMRIDTHVDAGDVTTSSFLIRNGAVFALRRDVHPDSILDTIYNILSSIPILSCTALA